MRRMAWTLGLLLLGAGCVRIEGPPAAAVRAAPGDGMMQVDAVCTLPPVGPTVERGVLVARLYEYDPRQTDARAREIGRTRLPGVTHRPGQKTVLRFSCAGRVVEHRAYYLTAVVYPEGAPAGSSGLYFLDGFRRVLETGNRETLRATLSPVADEDEPTN